MNALTHNRMCNKMIRSGWLWLSVRRVARRWSGWSDVWTQRSRSWPSQPEEPWGPRWLPRSPRNDRSLAAPEVHSQRPTDSSVYIRRRRGTELRRRALMTHNKHSNLVLMNPTNGTDPVLGLHSLHQHLYTRFISTSNTSYKHQGNKRIQIKEDRGC